MIIWHPLPREDKPSILDMGEAVIARLQEKSGAPKDKVLKNILADFGEMVEDAAKVENKLGIALVEGIEWGRLRQVGNRLFFKVVQPPWLSPTSYHDV